MTEPAVDPPDPPADLQAALRRIRDSGGRVTAAKRAVAELLYAVDGSRAVDEHLTVDDMVERLGEHDRSVIYRCVAQFEQLGIAEHVHLGHGQAVYRRRGLGTVPVHCSVCGGVETVRVDDVETFTRTVEERTGIRVDLTHFPLTGTCTRCAVGAARSH